MASRRSTLAMLHKLTSRLSNYWHKSVDKSGDRANRSASERALKWIKQNEVAGSGIRVHSNHSNAYPEVTGYLIPTLLDFGQLALAQRCTRWLLSIQRADGSFTDPDQGKPYVFDSGQVLRGLLSAIEIEPAAKPAALRVADYLCREMVDEGRGGFGKRYDQTVPESVLLYVLPPLMAAASVFDCPRYREHAESCLQYYLHHDDALRLDDLTHFLAYQLEALIDLGRADVALPVLASLQQMQQPDGAVRGVGGQSWVCTPGLAQLAICWYKVGQSEPADKAMGWLEAHQNRTGGWYGSYGRGATYFPKDELSWAAKFYLDANRLRVLSAIERDLPRFPDHIAPDDGRMQALVSVIQGRDRVIEIGCGKGRFLKAIKSIYPNVACAGVDIAPGMLAEVPADIRTWLGSLENVPIKDDSFDVVFSVEAIEHSANWEAAVREMARVARPGGWVCIIDKQKSAWGRLSCPSWERWPAKEELMTLLRQHCDQVTAEPVGYDGHAPDGLMLLWKGRKRSRLTGLEWNAARLGPDSRAAILSRLRLNQLSTWAQTMLLATNHGDQVLEIGSGTGEISLALAQAGRQVTALDVSAESLAFTRECGAELGVEINTLQADATQPLPLPDDAVDCIWSSGLLEHFKPEERHAMLSDWRRVARDQVISLVPNAASVAYRAGKSLQERAGTWAYGLEVPIQTLRQEYADAGLRVTREFTIAPRHALNFLPECHPLRQALSEWMDGLSPEELDDCGQGYLLVTIGVKGRGDGAAC